jgi:LPS O-antigen subunit length determinant protein (WzzB/FepE family)
MQTSTWITMAVIMGVIWGGFAVLLVTALRKESAKRERQGSGAEE